MAWIWLLIAGLLEIAWALGLKYSEGFTKLWPSVFTAIGMLLSYIALSQAMKTLPVGTAYPIWTGIGAVGTAIFGIILFNEPKTAMKFISVILITAGIIGLKMSSE
jgi:quaternary ammonium compound-resistance protein SugE